MDIKTLSVGKIELLVKDFQTEPKLTYNDALSEIKWLVKKYRLERLRQKDEADYIMLQRQAPCVMATQDISPCMYTGYAKALIVPEEIMADMNLDD